MILIRGVVFDDNERPRSVTLETDDLIYVEVIKGIVGDEIANNWHPTEFPWIQLSLRQSVIVRDESVKLWESHCRAGGEDPNALTTLFHLFEYSFFNVFFDNGIGDIDLIDVRPCCEEVTDED